MSNYNKTFHHDKPYNVYLASKNIIVKNTLPFLWCSSKTYYEENGLRANDWHWIDPWITTDTDIETILKACEEHTPHVFGCSVYVWNEEFMDDLGKRIRQLYPECLIVYGGPQIDIKYTDDYFKLHPWVDVVCPSDGYGEIIIQHLLDNYPVNDFETIPYIYYTNSNREKIFSKKGIEKRSFNWPNNIFKAQEQYLTPALDHVKVSFVETTRGCPYKCIYCDWGGGTYTKVTKKPYSTVLDELEWLAKHKFEGVAITDANFGIYDIDIDITEHLVSLNKKYGYPHVIHIDGAKNNLNNVARINEILAEANMLPFYKISVQSTNEEIKSNIERVDLPLEDQAKIAKHITSRFPNLQIKVQTILGMPGDNYQNNLDQIDLLIDYELPIGRSFVWLLLPEAPAFDPVMREKFKIKTVKKILNDTAILYKIGSTIDPGVGGTYVSENNTNVESVVGTYSYTPYEWVDMLVINSLATAGGSAGLSTYLGRYLKQEHNVKMSEMYDFIFKNFINNNTSFANQDLNYNFNNLISTLQRWVTDEEFKPAGIDYHPDFPLVFAPTIFIPFVIFLNLQNFYQEICQALANKYHDPKIVDLGKYISNGMLDITYNFDQGRKFSTDYNWMNYFVDPTVLKHGEYNWVVDDRTIFINQTETTPDWHKYELDSLMQKKQFYYQSVTTLNANRFSKTLRLT